MFEGLRTPCTINPELGQEARAEAARRPVARPQRILVVGGGPAGCQAAILAAQRGHEVTLIEQAERVGGQLRAWAAPSFRKTEIEALISHYETELAQAHVDVRLGRPAVARNLQGYGSVLLATGTQPDGIPDGAIDAVSMLAADDMPAGNDVTVSGGGTVAVHAALWLAEHGKQVTLMCPSATPADDVNILLAEHLLALLTSHGVKIAAAPTALPDATGNGAVVWAGPRQASSFLAELEDGTTVLPIGARLRGGLLYEATQSGYWAAASL